ncbi:MAG: glutamyl-tRNA reductase [Deltaproteobacteria bacterium]|nr:glutamyl-tRNA reductase [Candidatus Zymogenaceae bacterium]
MNLLSISLKVFGKYCLVVGGGAVGTRKVSALLNAGARVTVVSKEFSPRLEELDRHGEVMLIRKDFEPEVLDDAFLCIAAVNDRETSIRIMEACRSRGVLVNVADVPDMCDFYFPAVVNRGDLSIAISTGGVSPATARRIRQDLEDQYGPEYAGVLRVMGSIRESLRESGITGDRLAEIMGKIASLPLARIIAEGSLRDVPRIINEFFEEEGVIHRIDEDFDEIEDLNGRKVEIFVVGMSHKTAPVEVRERMELRLDLIKDFLVGLKEFAEITECVVLSTCNRVEILGCAFDVDRAVESSISYLGRFHGKDPQGMRKFSYIHRGAEAIAHIFQVASALDSMVVGEPQILGQVKDSYRSATTAETTGLILNRLMHRAFFTAKRVKNETAISSRPVSVSSAAVWVAEEVLGNLDGSRILVIGAGEMSEDTLQHLCGRCPKDAVIVNRTFKTARDLAERFSRIGARALPWEEMESALVEADVVVASTGSQEPVITDRMLHRVMEGRAQRPIVLIDIAVPRDVAPSVSDIPGVSLYNMDDLEDVVSRNIALRAEDADRARAIVEEETAKFSEWLKSLDMVGTIISLREKLMRIGKDEMEKLIVSWGGLDENKREKLEHMTTSIIKKILHDPTVYLKREPWLGSEMTINVVKGLLGLADEEYDEDQNWDEA